MSTTPVMDEQDVIERLERRLKGADELIEAQQKKIQQLERKIETLINSMRVLYNGQS